MAAVNRGTRLSRAIESRDLTAAALARSYGAPTEQDWRDALARCEERVAAEERRCAAGYCASQPACPGGSCDRVAGKIQ